MVAMGICWVSTTSMYTSRLAQCRTLSIIHGLSHGHTLPHIGTHRYTSIKRHTARQCHTGHGTPLPYGHLPFLQEYAWPATCHKKSRILHHEYGPIGRLDFKLPHKAISHTNNTLQAQHWETSITPHHHMASHDVHCTPYHIHCPLQLNSV